MRVATHRQHQVLCAIGNFREVPYSTKKEHPPPDVLITHILNTPQQLRHLLIIYYNHTLSFCNIFFNSLALKAVFWHQKTFFLKNPMHYFQKYVTIVL